MTLKTRPDPNGNWTAHANDVTAHIDGLVPLPPIPDVACKGLCTASCAIVPTTAPERERAAKDLHRPFGMLTDGTCNALVGGRCAVYLNRPLICRIYGGAEGIICDYGCDLRSGEWLSYAEGMGHLSALQRAEGEATIVWVRS